jgi:hypothetical protein
MSPVAIEHAVFTRRARSVTVKSSDPLLPLRARRNPTSTSAPPVDAVDAKTTSGIPSPFRSMTEGVIMTFNAVGSTALDVQDHSRMGLNWALRMPAEERTPARDRGTSR